MQIEMINSKKMVIITTTTMTMIMTMVEEEEEEEEDNDDDGDINGGGLEGHPSLGLHFVVSDSLWLGTQLAPRVF